MNELITTEQAELVTTENIRVGSMDLADYREVVSKMSGVAKELTRFIRQRELYVAIHGKEYVFCEGWTSLGGMLGVTSKIESCVENPNIEGEFIAAAVAFRTSDGAELGRAEASCGPDEEMWRTRSRQAKRSMSQTRATSKVFRLTMSWVMKIAGFEVTPAEEMQGGGTVKQEPSVDFEDITAKESQTFTDLKRLIEGLETLNRANEMDAEIDLIYSENRITVPERVSLRAILAGRKRTLEKEEN